MPTLETGPPIKRIASRERGFTLIEILVVVVIIGTIVAISLLSFNLLGDDRQLQTEARRLTSLVEVAQDEAAMQGREFGLELMNNSYRFVEYDALAGVWAQVPGDDTLRMRPLPDDVEFQLFLEDKRVLLEDDPAPFEDPDKENPSRDFELYSPHLLIYSSGDSTPFELHLWRPFDDQRAVLRGNALGAIEIGDEDDGEF